MRILHTADLHLGRQFNQLGLEDDHAAVLDQIVAALSEHRADVLVIAGDIFDRASPPASAVRQFNGFLSRVAETPAAVVMIAGNHDQGDRIGAMAAFTDRRRALIRGVIACDEPPLVLADAHGPVAFSGLPFCHEYAARACFADEGIACPQDVLAAQIAAARAALPPQARWVVVAHAFVAGAAPSEGERPLARVGGIETVEARVFDGAHYVALGHLHRPQAVGVPHIRYSGSPLAFGFDEAGEQKSMSLVDLDAQGAVTVTLLPFAPPRGVRVVQGLHADLLRHAPSADIIRAVLADPAPVIDAMRRLRAVFPHACDLIYDRDGRAPEGKGMAPATRATDPVEMVGDFLAQVRGERADAAEIALIARALHDLTRDEDVA